MQVHQFHHALSLGDAISGQVQSLQHMLQRLGYTSEIFCEQLPHHLRGRVLQFTQYASHSSPENVLLVHFSRGYSRQVMAWLGQIPDRKVLIYHNITPPAYFAGINPMYMEATRAGREQLSELAALTEAGWGVSSFNCQDLSAHGWDRIGVLPIVFEPGRYTVRPDRRVLRRYRDGLNVLSVGRIAPNKRLEDLILAFHYLKRYVRPQSRLLVVGSSRGMEPYLEFLQALVRKLCLSDVVFTGHVSASQLVAYYTRASVYLSMSEHEGFGVPFLESMYFGVPIVAYKTAAVPETLGGCGLLVKHKEYAAVAELIGLLAKDRTLWGRVVERQRERLRDFTPDQVERRLQALMRDLER